jgi:hypothetical protein
MVFNPIFKFTKKSLKENPICHPSRIKWKIIPEVVIPTLSSEEDDEIINSVIGSGGGRGAAIPGEGRGGAASGEISFLLP